MGFKRGISCFSGGGVMREKVCFMLFLGFLMVCVVGLINKLFGCGVLY